MEEKRKNLTLNISMSKDFEGDLAVFAYDTSGNLLASGPVKKGKATLKISERQALAGRVFIAPELPEEQKKPSLQLMERIKAYEPVLKPGLQGGIKEAIRIPGSIIDHWHFCFCWVRGRVVKTPDNLPICGARVHICEVDKLPRFIIRLPDPDIFRLRDDLLKELTKRPEIPRPPRPLPDPPPFRVGAAGRINPSNIAALNPQPLPPASDFQLRESSAVEIDPALHARLRSASATIVRQALLDNIKLIYPYLCLWPWWWRYKCDEIRVLETGPDGRFETIIIYPCNGDKPDLYFWVEYQIGSTWETVYHPPIPCNTYWNYHCGTEVVLNVSDQRVPACDSEPDLPGCIVQIMSIGRKVSMSEIQGPGASSSDEGLTTQGEPFGGKLEPRVWFSRSCLIDDKNITHYRWSYRRLSEGDGTMLSTPGPWTPLTRTVVRHYAKPISGGGVTHEPVVMGPETVGGKPNLFKIKPAAVPSGGIEWTVVDEREDLASGHFETAKLGTGDNACDKAFDSAGHYELKLELFNKNGDLVNWSDESIGLQITDVPAPFGTDPVTASDAGNYHRVLDGSGKTVGFRMVLRVDNNCCEAKVEPVTGTGLTLSSCGFVEFAPGAAVNLHFKAGHPNSFANFDFNLTRGVSTHVAAASAAARVGTAGTATDDSSHTYALTVPSDYRELFAVADLLGPCDRAAFAETLHVRAMAQNGYNRLSGLDRSDVDGFALTAPCPPCECNEEEEDD